MIKQLKIVIRNLIKNPTFGFVTVVGFAFSFAIALLLASYVFNELSYDKDLPNVDRVYRLCTEKTVVTLKGDLKDELKNHYPEIEQLCRYDREDENIDVICKKTPYCVDNFVKTDNEFFSIFSVHILSGNTQNPMPDLNSIAISSSLAKTIFGNQDPIGQFINVMHKKEYKITAVFDDLPVNSSIQAKLIMPWENVNKLGGEWGNGIYYSRYFFLLNINNDAKLLAKKIAKDYPDVQRGDDGALMLLPFNKSYMSPVTAAKLSNTAHANLQSIFLFSIVTVLILIISVLNFVILFTSNHMARLKEIGVKKAVGADKSTIFRQFIFEAVIVSIIAFLLGIFISYIFKAPFTTLVDKDFEFSLFLRFPNILFIVLGVLLMGGIAGFYPAFVVSKYKPVSIFSQVAKRENLRIKSGLSVIQYSISIVLIVSLIVMARQNRLLINKDLGFSKEQLINIDVPYEVKGKLPLIKERLIANPYIKSCAVSHGIPGRVCLWGFWNEASEKYGYKGNLPYFTVDADFFKVYDADFIQGRGFEQDDWGKAVVMNETAFKLTGWKSIEGNVLKGIPTPEQAFRGDPNSAQNNTLKVVGVIKDINVEKLEQLVAPTIFECSDHFGISYLTCRVLPGDYSKVINDIKNIWEDVCPEYTFSYQFYDSWLDSLYKEEQHSAYVIRVFAILSIIITCLGTFGVIHFVTRQRIKEVGVRKVNGARVLEILQILNWDIVKWIVVAFIIATPVAWYTMHKWLESFAYKTSLSWWIFALAGLLALGIALLTVSWQSWRAATRNPVEALRYE